VRVYSNLGKFRGDSLFSTWLYRIAVNLCRNRHRSWWQRLWRNRVRIDSSPGDTERGQTEIGDTSTSPDTDLERSQRAEMVHRALGELDEKYRELLLLRDFQDKSYEEIGEITGLALGTVKSRLARARQAMQKKLEVLLHE
jgi:RNA polymerase sigma-70 factor, ECF subfamily